MKYDNSRALLIEFVRRVLSEQAVTLRVPRTFKEEVALRNLVVWAGTRMDVSDETLNIALKKSKYDDWSDVLEIMRDFYVLKGIKFKQN